MKLLGKGIIPLSAAGAAALLSMITGFISAVNPVKILFRGLLAAVAAGAFMMLADWLVKTFLPELGELKGQSGSAATEAPEQGGRVNIVMPDEMPRTSQEPLNGESAAPGENGEGGETLQNPGALSPGDNEIAESMENVHNNKPEDPDTAAAAAESLDTLPNLDSLEISIGSASEEAGNTETLDSVTPSPAGTDVDLGENGDPEIIAKAVKTVLARDQQK